MNLTPTLFTSRNMIFSSKICRDALFPGLKIIFLALPLSGCLKVTGPAKDGFDLENEEPKVNLSGLIFKTRITDENEEPKTKPVQLEKAEDSGDANLSTPTDDWPDEPGDNLSSEAENKAPDVQPELPERDSSKLSPQDVADFDAWKKARSEDSSQYQEFREYLEFKEFQKWQKLQNESKSD